MITVRNIVTPSGAQWDAAIRGMRNPMNSWDKSDSVIDNEKRIILGENDLNLMKRLYSGGTEHRKYLRMLPVVMDVEAPLYWWKEADTYKVCTVSNSCSTMHKIQAKKFERFDFSWEHLDTEEKDVMTDVLVALNWNRNKFLETGDKKYWWHMIQMLPTSYNQKRTWSFNYETAVNIIHQREHHKLDEWLDLVAILRSELPYLKEIMGE